MPKEEKSYNLDIEKECAKNHLERIIAIFKKYEESIYGRKKYDFIEQLKKDSEQGALKSKFEGEVDIPCYDWYYWKRVRYSGRLDENGDYILTISEEAYSNKKNKFLYATKADYRFYRNVLGYEEYYHPIEYKDQSLLDKNYKAPSYHRYIYDKYKNITSVREIYREYAEVDNKVYYKDLYQFTDEDKYFLQSIFGTSPIQPKYIAEQYSIIEEAINNSEEYQIASDGLTETFSAHKGELLYELLDYGLLLENTIPPSNFVVIIKVWKNKSEIKLYNHTNHEKSKISYEELLDLIEEDPGLRQNKIFVQKVIKLNQLGCFKNLDVDEKKDFNNT